MSILHILSGKVNKINRMTREVIDFNSSKISTNIEFDDTVLVMSAAFADKACSDLFNPKYNILIKYVNDINENDLNSIYCILVSHFVYRFFCKPFLFFQAKDNSGKTLSFDKNFTISNLEKKLKFSIDEYKNFENMELSWEVNNKGIESPTIRLIIKHCHTQNDSILSEKILRILICTYNYTENVFTS